MLADSDAYRRSLFLRLVYELVDRGVMEDYSGIESGMDLDRGRVSRRLEERYPDFLQYRKEVIGVCEDRLCQEGMSQEEARERLSARGWRVSILEGYERGFSIRFLTSKENML